MRRTGKDASPPDPDRLKERLAPFAPAFDLLGDGPRFLQDMEAFEGKEKDPNPADMLFIDSAGGQTLRNNADLSVKRARYPVLSLGMAAMALFTLQAHAPSGGKGNRTSMRGGGPMVTLVDPGQGLWSLIWANVPGGAPATPDVLPWMRATRGSAQGQEVFPQDAHPAEALFGMPRRLRLVGGDEGIRGVVQRPYGTDYAGWEHPLTPHYRQKPGAELLPRHPRAGWFGYRNWLGVSVRRGSEDDTVRRARMVDLWGQRSRDWAEILVAGWAMDNMKPRDFVFSRAPVLNLPGDVAAQLEGMVEAADKISAVLRGALAPVLAEGEAREAAREVFFMQTQAAFEARAGKLTAVNFMNEARGWLEDMRAVALRIFNDLALPGLADRDSKAQAEIIGAQRGLVWAFAGYGKLGREAYLALGLPVPEQKKGKAA
ncbi:MAG: type I-E CRISPR-associated protein Cse1/CasA [Paracoccaceae bacterium]